MSQQQRNDIGVFLSVCANGSFAAAATHLHLSPSAVAKTIARIEGRLGVRRFQRSTRSLRLTAEGATYQGVCLETRRELERVEEGLRALAQAPSGLLRVSLPPLLGVKVIAPALYDLCRKWPSLELDISTGTNAIDLLQDGVDLAVRVGELPDTGSMVTRRLGQQKIVLCAAPSYIERMGVPNDVNDLSRHALVAEYANGRIRPWQFTNEDGSLISLHPRRRLSIEGSGLALSAVLEGMGIGCLPAWLITENIAEGQLVTILDNRLSGHLPVHAVWPASPVMLPRLRVAIDAIVATIGPRLAAGEQSEDYQLTPAGIDQA